MALCEASHFYTKINLFQLSKIVFTSNAHIDSSIEHLNHFVAFAIVSFPWMVFILVSIDFVYLHILYSIRNKSFQIQ